MFSKVLVEETAVQQYSCFWFKYFGDTLLCSQQVVAEFWLANPLLELDAFKGIWFPSKKTKELYRMPAESSFSSDQWSQTLLSPQNVWIKNTNVTPTKCLDQKHECFWTVLTLTPGPKPPWVLRNITETISMNIAGGDCAIALAILYAQEGWLVEATTMVCSHRLSPSMWEVPGLIPGPHGHTAQAFFAPPSLSWESIFTPFPLPCKGGVRVNISLSYAICLIIILLIWLGTLRSFCITCKFTLGQLLT